MDNLISLFKNIVALNADKISLEHEDVVVTYQELYDKSIRFASYINDIGCENKQVISILLDNSVELICSVWATLLSGNAYLPISPEYPFERIKYIVEDSNTNIIITNKVMKNNLSAILLGNIKIIDIEYLFTNVGKLKELSNSLVNIEIQTNDPAYIIYTSGSTGFPKGVVITHGNLVNQINWLRKEFMFDSNTIFLQKTPIGFDAAQWEILSNLFGGKIIIGQTSIYKDVNALKTIINKYYINTIQCVPTLLQEMVDNGILRDCASLTKIFCGGEVLSKQLGMSILSETPNVKLINLYGPTECTINATYFIVNNLTNEMRSVPIGYAIDNMIAYIINSNGSVIENNDVGELCFAGLGIASGYLGKYELTAERFIANTYNPNISYKTIYKTGDLVYRDKNGCIYYVDRIDRQIKLRGYRIELGEIESQIEDHNWVKKSAVVVKKSSINTEYLAGYIELDQNEALLMDQGNHGGHHQTKACKTQVKFQLSNNGKRDFASSKILLPYAEPSESHINMAFSRKSYRFFNSGDVTKLDIISLLNSKLEQITEDVDVSKLDINIIGNILRYFGQFTSKERLLPKYGYASPGSLYATQIYLEILNINDFEDGLYYYDPIIHAMCLVSKENALTQKSSVKIHFLGKIEAIEPVYRNNVLEVLEMESGHIIGLFDKVLLNFGLGIGNYKYDFDIDKFELGDINNHHYMGSFNITSFSDRVTYDDYLLYVQINNDLVDIKRGTYLYAKNEINLQHVSDDIILKKDVIAINQEVYSRSNFGISIINNSDNSILRYILLGRKLQELQMNNICIGLMSSGYSSKTLNDLLSAKKIRQILNIDVLSSYFCIGGKITQEQISHQGMNEDIVHMKGPLEILTEDIRKLLPTYMVPDYFEIVTKLPLTPNGKIDYIELKHANDILKDKEVVLPRNEVELKIQKIWGSELKLNDISVKDNFFLIGGNSLKVISIVNKINKNFNIEIPIQLIFEHNTIEKMAIMIHDYKDISNSRAIVLNSKSSRRVFCWPGLGGFCMNLKELANALDHDFNIIGIQAQGINKGEKILTSLKEIAEEDIKLLSELQPKGPYILMGYSFGSKVAFEVAKQLESLGEKVESVFMIAPGMPNVSGMEVNDCVSYTNQYFISVLFSVFMGRIYGEELIECLNHVTSKTEFINFISNINKNLPKDLIGRVVDVVESTFGLGYKDTSVMNKLNINLSVFKAYGDSLSFIEESAKLFKSYNITHLHVDHYNILKKAGVDIIAHFVQSNSNDCQDELIAAVDLQDLVS